MKILLIQFALVGALLSQHPGPAMAQSLSAEQAALDAAILVNTMQALHPALDKYRTPAQVAASFERFRQRATAARSAGEMYLAATELAAAVRCGHTWTNVLNQQGPVKKQLLEAPDKLPFTMTLVAGRWLVLASADPAIAAGDEVLAIDGRTALQVVSMMLPYLRADGASDGKRLRQLGHDRDDYSMMDIVWPLLAPPAAGVYRISAVRGAAAPKSVEVRAITLAARAAAIRPRSKPDERWSLRIDGARAVMTLPTFSVYRSKFDWKHFFSDSFAELRRANVEQLVIDIRRNEGGDGAIGTALLSYLVAAPMTHVSDQSVTMVERVPAEMQRHLQTWDVRFFDRSGLVDQIADGPQAGRLSFRPNARKLVEIAPQPMRFTGKAWLLVGPENSSATFMLAKLAKASGAATLIGQVTGGNERGLNGGQLAWVTLPASGVAVDIPLLAATYSATTPDAGVTPDIVVYPSFALRAAGRDQEMEALDKLLQRP
ncbi:MAG: S41 family peptidase [Pseudomonadota bacterium]